MVLSDIEHKCPEADTAESKQAIRVLVVDDNEAVREACGLLFAQNAIEVAAAASPSEAKVILASEPIDAVLADLNFRSGERDGAEGIAFVDTLRRNRPDLALVVFSAFSGINLAVSAMQKGADDFVVKPWSNDRLVDAVRRAIDKRRAAAKRGSHSGTRAGSGRIANPIEMVGTSAETRALQDQIALAAATRANVFISGGRGLGKRLVAQLIHGRSQLRDEPLREIDLRLEGSAGLLELLDRTAPPAASSTVLVRHIDLLEQAAFDPLARALSDGLRVLSTSTANVADLEADGGLGATGLLYGLATIEIAITPLETRPEDYAAMAAFYLDLVARRRDSAPAPVTADQLRPVEGMTWPGGVRQLIQFAERSILFDIPLDQLVHRHMQDRYPVKIAPGEPTLAQVEKNTILRTLSANSGNIMATARELGMSRPALYRRLRKYDR